MLHIKTHVFLYILISLYFVQIVNALADKQVNIYSARKEALIKPLLDTFSKNTGITVNLITGKADTLLTRLRLEGRETPADVFITVDASRLHRAKTAGVLQPIINEQLTRIIPANLRDVDGYWYGLSQRARPIFYAKNRINPHDLSTYEALADPKWRGRICMRSSNNVYNQSLIASMLEATGEVATQQWLEKLVKQFAKPPAGGDIDQLKAVASGLCDITVANTYYFARLIASSDHNDRDVANKLAIFWPNQKDRGVHVNVSGAGITTYAKNKESAIMLLEFLTSTESQLWYSTVNYEYPVVDRVNVAPILAMWGTFKADTIDLSKLGLRNRKAVELMDYAAWK